MSQYTLSGNTTEKISNVIQRIKDKEYVHETIDTEIPHIELEIKEIQPHIRMVIQKLNVILL